MPFDPTGTARLRGAFRREAARRLATVLRLTRIGVVDHDMLGLRPLQLGGGMLFMQNSSGNADKLRQFADWFAGIMTTVFLSDYSWLIQHLNQAYASGQRAAEGFSKQSASARMDDSFRQQAVHEVEGIIAAAVQQAARSMADSVRARSNPRMAYNRISRIVKKIAGNRLNILCNHFVVLLHNRARLDEFAALGVRKIGIVPEKLPGQSVRDHAHAGCQFHDLEIVNVLTAGDDLVCQACEDIAAGSPYTIEEADGLIPAHLSCRCAYVPIEDARFAEPEESEWFAA